MAEAASVVSFLLQNLPQLLVQEARLLDGVKDQVNSFQNHLNLINVFLEQSGKKRDKCKINEEIVRQIRDVALRGEDVIDSYIYKAAKQMRRSLTGQIIRLIPHHKNLHTIGMKIEVINLEFEKINKDKEQFVIAKTAQEAEAEEKAAKKLYNRRYAGEDEVVGFGHNSTKLLNQLIEGKLELDVSSIFGMGGLGKTTLARKIYQDARVQKRFNCQIWVCISQDFRRKELLIEILKSAAMQTSESNNHLCQDLNKDVKELQEELSKCKLEDLNEKELKEKLARYLSGKTYLVVMDDVWTTDVWDEVGDAFPRNVNGSRILITSRNKKVVLHAKQSADTPPYFLPFLTAEESWELLRRKVFHGEECPPHLKILGKEIAKSCNGLPLSIVVLAGLLASKEKEEHKWKELHSNVKWHLSQEKERCEAILALSYTQLPQYLKPCFLYFGLYPKNFEIPVRQLIQLWIAEGFIQNTAGSNMEDVAENYLDELIDRCLIQVACRRTGGGAKTCRIHDLLRDLCISESMEEKFLKVCTDDDNSSTERTRRLSILGSTTQYICSNPFDPSCARSLLCFGQNIYLKQKHWKWVFKYTKFVRVLNFGGTIFHCIPDDIEKLMYLKYLRIESENLEDIPSSICNLRYLETLDARRSMLNCLPDGIWKLQCLRNLYLSGSKESFPQPLNPGVTLSKLQILSTVTVHPQIVFKLLNLRKLGMKLKLQSEETLKSLHQLQHLQILKITDCSELPSGADSLPQTITKITLIRVHFKSMTMLGNLPKLLVLKLQYCSSDNLSFAAGSFPGLKVLKLDELSITEWKLGIGAMPQLQHLVIKKCTSLTLLPEELYKKTYLQNVEVLWTTLTLARMLQELKMKMKFGFEVQIYPPLEDDHYKTCQ